MLYFYLGFPRISLMFWRLTAQTQTHYCAMFSCRHVVLQLGTKHRRTSGLSFPGMWVILQKLFHRLEFGVWFFGFFFPFSLERPFQCKCRVDATSCQMQEKHAGLNHHLQYLESDVMPIVFPTFNVLFLMLQHGLCFSNSLMLWERSLHARLNLFISNFHSSNKLHKIISPFACIVWNSAITLHQILLPPLSYLLGHQICISISASPHLYTAVSALPLLHVSLLACFVSSLRPLQGSFFPAAAPCPTSKRAYWHPPGKGPFLRHFRLQGEKPTTTPTLFIYLQISFWPNSFTWTSSFILFT